MVDDYELHVGGIDTSADLIISDIVDMSINLNESAMSDFSATIPKTTNVRQYLQDDIYLIEASNSDDITWFGTLEKWEEGESDARTIIGGRGPQLADKQQSVEIEYNSTFADEALEHFKNNYTTESYEYVTRDRDKRVAKDTPVNDGEPNASYPEDSEDMSASTSVTQGDGTDKGTLTAVDSATPINDLTYSGDHAWRFEGASDRRDNGDAVNIKTLSWPITVRGDVASGDITAYVRYNIDDGEDVDLRLNIGGTVYEDTISINNTSGSPTHEWAQFAVGGSANLSDATDYDVELNFDGEIDTFIDIDAVAIVDNSTGVIVDDEQTDTYYVNPAQYETGASSVVQNEVQISSSEEFTDWEVFVKYSAESSKSVVGISDRNSNTADETTTVEGEAREFGHSELSCASPEVNPYVYVTTAVEIPETFVESGQRGRAHIDKITAFPSDSSQRYIINEEINGDVLSGMQRLCEIAGYRFSPQNFNASTNTFILFPIGFDVPSPDWRILEATRSSDFAGYANQVTVRGAFDEERSEYSRSTVSNQDEISVVGKTIERYDKRVDLETDAECRSVAKTLLSSSIQNRGESGSLTTSIPPSDADVIVGAKTPIYVWNHTFNDGGLVGENALYFQNGTDDTQVARDNGFVDTNSDKFFRVNIYPHLDSMSHEVSLISTGYQPELLTLEPDGTLNARASADDEPPTVSTAAGAVIDRTTQTVEYYYDSGAQEIQLSVDGAVVASGAAGPTFTLDPSEMFIGNRNRESVRNYSHRGWDNSDVLLTWDELSYDSGNTEFTNFAQDTSVGNATEVNSGWTQTTHGEGAYREAIKTTNTDLHFSVGHDDALNIGASQTLTLSSWVYIEDGSSSTDDIILRKRDSSNGYVFGVDNNRDLYVKIYNGGQIETIILDSSFHPTYNGEWVHVTVTIDNNVGEVQYYYDGDEQDTYSSTHLDGSDLSNTDDLEIMLMNSTTNEFRLDETRVYGNTILSDSVISTLASTGPEYDDNFVGGIDEFEFIDGDSSGSTEFKFGFDDNTTPNTALDDSTNNSDGVIQNVEFAAVAAPIREMSYTFFGDAVADVKFDIAGRIDTELVDVRSNVENTKE